MTQRDRDRLVVLRKAQKKLITQQQAARELELSERHVRRLLVRLRESGDKSVIHGLRGRESNRRLSAETREKAARILSEQVYRGFGPTLASEYLAKKPNRTKRAAIAPSSTVRRRFSSASPQKVSEDEWRPREASGTTRPRRLRRTWRGLQGTPPSRRGE